MKRRLTRSRGWLPALLLSACAPDRPVDFAFTEEVRGDTVVVTSLGDPAPTVIDAVTVVWRSDELADPVSMARVGGRLVVGDRTRVHVLSTDGDAVLSFGRSGDGPGEFRTVTAVGGFGGDTLAVFDGALRRVSFFTLEGAHLASRRTTPTFPFVSPTRGGPPLVRLDGGLLLAETENVNFERPMRFAVLWRDLEADSASVLHTFDDVHFTRLDGGVIGPRELFAPRAIVAIAQDGRVAHGNGRDYCIRLHRPFGEDVRVVCRDRARIRTGPGIRSPDFSALEDDSRLEMLVPAWREQSPGDVLPHFDLVRFAESGELWVRTLHEELADIHPNVASLRPELGPREREWEVFTAEGRLQRVLRVPAAFDPRVMDGEDAWGFFTLETGEVTIARVELPPG